MFKRKTARVGRPEDDAAFRKLEAERLDLHATIEKASITWERGRGRLDQLSAAASAGEHIDREAMRELAEEVDEADRQRAKARRRLREIADQLPMVRQRAAGAIAAEHQPRLSGLARDYLMAKLQRLGPELVAAIELRRLRDEFTARRVPLAGMMPATAAMADVEHQQLFDDVTAALAAGVLTTADVPADLRQAWGIS